MTMMSDALANPVLQAETICSGDKMRNGRGRQRTEILISP